MPLDTLTVADELAFDALPDETRLLCERIINSRTVVQQDTLTETLLNEIRDEVESAVENAVQTAIRRARRDAA